MLIKNNFSKNSIKSKNYIKNLKKTKISFKSLLRDIENFEIPLIESFEKNYKLDFSPSLVKKFFRYQNIIIIGMGGSILGTKSIYSFLKYKIRKNVFFFDNLDSNLYLQYKKINKLKNSCFIVVSKSGNTLETITNLCAVFSKKFLKNKLIIITEIKDSALINIGNKYNAEIISHQEFIGGRYSVLSETGMLPAALMGLNINKFKNLKIFLKKKKFVSSLIQSVSAIYTLTKKKINNSVIFSYDSSLNDLSYWYQQLTAESLGKKGNGVYPTLSFGPKDNHSLLQLYLDGPKDKFFTFLNTSKKEKSFKINSEIVPQNMAYLKKKNLKVIIKAQYDATKNIFKMKKIPFREIIFNKKNENELGEIFTFFVLETILLSKLMKINPFDQPAVEQVKIETKNILS